MKNLKTLLIIHGIVTFMAACVLIISPSLIPQTVDITLQREQYLLSYFLGAAELGIAFLSFQSRKINEKFALKTIVYSFIIFHLITAVLELYAAIAQDLSTKIFGNITLRIIITLLLYYFGIHKINRQKT